MMKSNDKPIFL